MRRPWINDPPLRGLDDLEFRPIKKPRETILDRLDREMAAGVSNDATLRTAIENGYLPQNLKFEKCSKCFLWSFSINLKPAYSGMEFVCSVCADKYTHCDGCDSLILKTDNTVHIHGTELRRLFPLNELQEFNANIIHIRGNALRHGTNDREPPGGFRYLGVELEVERGDVYPPDLLAKAHMALDPEFVIMKRDGSLTKADPRTGLRSNGFEVVTLPATLNYHLKELGWQRFFDAVSPYAQAKPPTTGLHVHVSSASLTTGALGKVVKFINSKDNLPFLRVIADREFDAPSPNGKTYAVIDDPDQRVRDLISKKIHDPRCPMSPNGRVLKKYYLTDNQRARLDPYGNPIIQGYGKPGNLLPCKCPGGKYDYAEHYSALNLKTGHPTLEFRIFQGSMNPVHFFSSLEFCSALIDFCETVGFRNLTYSEFIDWFGSNRSRYRHLEEWLSTTGYIRSRKRA